MPRGVRRKRPSIEAELQRIGKELTALSERVREAEAVKNAVDSYVAAAAKPKGKPGRKPGAKLKVVGKTKRRRRRKANAKQAAG